MKFSKLLIFPLLFSNVSFAQTQMTEIEQFPAGFLTRTCRSYGDYCIFKKNPDGTRGTEIQLIPIDSDALTQINEFFIHYGDQPYIFAIGHYTYGYGAFLFTKIVPSTPPTKCNNNRGQCRHSSKG